MVKISVIIPIYNVEQYLARCLDSVVNQTYKDLEIICVNDCSPDNSGKILEWYAKKDNRIKVISRDKNGGLSAARNTGLDAASCEYIYFIDSDDWIDPDYIETMYCAAQESKAEAVLNTSMCLHYENEPQNTHFRKVHNNYSHCFVDANEAILKVNWNTVLHFWKKSFLDKIHARFPEGYFIEDIYFQAVTYIYLHKIYVIRESAYHYWIRKTGIMGSVSEDIFSPNLRILNKIVDYYEENNISEDLKIKLIFHAIFPWDRNRKKFEELRKYFLRIKNRVNNNRELYTRLELLLFDAVLKDVDNALNINFEKIALLEKLEKSMPEKK